MEPVRRSRPPAVAEAAAQVLGAVEELSERTTRDVVLAIPSYRDHRDELGRSVRHTLRTFLDYCISGVPPGSLELARLRDVGRRRAEGRVPLADVLRAYRILERAILSTLSGSPKPLSSEGVLWVAEALVVYIDEVSTEVTSRYAETQVDLLRAQESRRRDFLADLLLGQRAGPAALEEAASLGIEPLAESRVLLVGLVDPSQAELGGDIDVLVEDMIAPTPVLSVRVGGDLVVVPLGPADAGAIAARLGAVVIGEGRIHPGFDGIRQSYAEAREALSIARATGAGPVARFSDLVLDRLLRQDPALLAEFVSQTVGTVQAYDARRRTDLVRTLEVWAEEGGSPTAAASRLHVHPHTVAYRLGRVEDLTGFSLSVPEHRLQLLLGLRATRLLDSSFVSATRLHADNL
jgi:PucR-like helix-turn-helix protein/diguanylate cyclase with GGDEF domain